MRGRDTAAPALESIPVRFALPPPAGARFGNSRPSLEATTVAVSPDGLTVAFIVARPGEAPRIWVRPLGADAARDLPGTDAAISMFWSPDGLSLGFALLNAGKRSVAIDLRNDIGRDLVRSINLSRSFSMIWLKPLAAAVTMAATFT